MTGHIVILIGSPKSENSTSNIISKNLEKKLASYHQTFSKLFLFKELHNETTLLEKVAVADTLILISPVYGNSVSSTVLQFFELATKHKEFFTSKSKQFFVLTSMGFADLKQGKTHLNTCKLFSEAMSFSWLGGITISPGPLIEGEDLGKLFANLDTSLDLIAKSLSQNTSFPPAIWELNAKPALPALLYRIMGSIYQKKPMKTLGKNAFYARPLL